MKEKSEIDHENLVKEASLRCQKRFLPENSAIENSIKKMLEMDYITKSFEYFFNKLSQNSGKYELLL